MLMVKRYTKQEKHFEMKTYSVTNGKKLVLLLTIGFTFLCGIKAESTPNKDFAEKEENIEVEEWMDNLDKWEFISLFKADEESEMEIEDWMLTANEENWDLTLKVDQEEEMEIEKWMTNLKKWK